MKNNTFQKIRDSQLIDNLLNRGELPEMEVKTTVPDDTIIKLSLAIVAIILVAVLAIRLTKW